jgi:hypothetical protein
MRLGGLAVAALALAPGAALAFDAGAPADVLGMIKAAGATGEIHQTQEGPVIAGSVEGTAFALDFNDCNADKSSCRTLVYRTKWEKASPVPTLAQINGWNLGAKFCVAVLTPEGDPGISYTVVVEPGATAEVARTRFETYRNCLRAFSAFGPNPDAFLKGNGIELPKGP